MADSKPILTIYNRHPEPGPREFDTSTGFWSYFMNEHGEQWIFHIDREDKSFLLVGGDLRWEYEVTTEEGLASMVFNDPEQLWVLACLGANKLDEMGGRIMMRWAAFRREVASYGTGAKRK